jgi:hypothetical protein
MAVVRPAAVGAAFGGRAVSPGAEARAPPRARRATTGRSLGG